MLARRKQSVDYFSPCSSSNQKWLDHPFHHPARRPVGNTTTQSSEEEEVREDQSRSEMSGSARSSDVLLMMMMAGGRRGSSHASCGAWSLGSLKDRVPVTPSPICSPVESISCSPPPSDLCSFYHSFATQNQSSCGVSNDGKKSESPEEEADEGGGGREEESKKDGWKPFTDSRQTRLRSLNNLSPMRSSRGGECSIVKQSCSPNSHHNAGVIRAIGPRFPLESSDHFGASVCGDDRRLPAVDEEERERGCKKDRQIVASNLLSPDDGYFTGSSGSGSGSGYENSDIESVIDGRLGSGARERWGPLRTSMAETRRNEVEAKLTSWKETRTMKLVNKLKKEEAAIDQWERKQTAKAKMEMKEFELRLEKRRERALAKMQRRIRITQKKAAKKKLKERAAAAKKVSKVAQAFEKMAVTGKLPWRLVFL